METYTPDQSKIVHTTSVDFNSRTGVPHPIHVVQYDTKQPIIEVKLYNMGKRFTMQEGSEANIRLSKPDGTSVYNPTLGMNEAKDTLYFTVSKKMTEVHGTLNPIVELVVGNTISGSASFPIIIDRNPIREYDIKSSSEYGTLMEYVEEAGKSKDAAAQSAAEALASQQAAKASQDAAKTSEDNADASEAAAAQSASDALASQTAAKESENEALASQNAAKASEDKALASQTAAKESEDKALASQNAAAVSAEEALASQTAALASQQAAKESERSAAESQADALVSKNAAEASAAEALDSQKAAASSQTAASASQTAAAASEAQAKHWEELSESYAHGQSGARPDVEDTDNAKYYYEQARDIALGLEGSLLPMGTIKFANLENQTKQSGFMYNIEDEFDSTEDFKDGGGKHYGAGSNVYWTADGHWDVLAANVVSGVKGSAEGSFRQGNVSITPEDISLGYHKTEITFTFSGWGVADTTGAMKQTVSNSGIKDVPALVVSAQTTGATTASSKTYMKNFGFLASGYVTVEDGSVTAAVFKKPISDLTVNIIQRY